MPGLDALQENALPLAREERAAHLRGFRGRASLLDRLGEAPSADDAGRFTLLLGGPGAGKSAFAAALSDRLGAPYHFARSHREPRRFVASLIAQCQAAAGSPASADHRADQELASSDDLKNALCEALSALVRARGRADVVIDAVDELERPVDLLSFLPGFLPPSSNVFLTARPELTLVASLRARYRPLEVITLPPITLDDLRGGPALPEAELESLLEKTGGVPLLLFPALAKAEQAGHVDLAQVAASERDLFEGLVAEASHRAGPFALRILSVLSLLSEPLPPALLGEVLDVLSAPGPALHELRLAIEALSGMLEVSHDGAIRLWHAAFAQYVRVELVGRRDVPSLHEAIARACGRAATSPFALRNAVLHLSAAGDSVGAGRLAESAGRFTAQLEAGLMPEALRDLERVGSCWLAPLRRQGAFLSTHPGALPSALSFEGIEPPASDLPWVRTLWRAPPLGPMPTIALEGALPEVLSLALCPDGTRLAVATQDGHVREYDATSGRLLREQAVSHRRALVLAYAPRGRWLACGTDDGVSLLDLASPPCAAREIACEAPVWALGWLPDGALVVGSRQGELTIFDAALEPVWSGRLPFAISALAVGPGGSLIVGGARDGIVVLGWQGAPIGGAEPQRWRLEESADGAVWSIAVQDGRFAMARHDGTLAVFELQAERGPRKLAELMLPDDRLFAVSFVGANVLLCAGSAGRLHRVTLTLEGLVSDVAWAAHRGWINALASAGARVWSAGTDGVVLAHDIGAEALVADQRETQPTALACSLGGEEVAIGHGDGNLEVRAGLAGEPTLRARATFAVSALALSPRFVLLGGRDGSLWLHRRSVGPTIKRRRLSTPTLLERHDAEVTAAWFVSGHGYVVTASRDRTVRLHALVGARRVAIVETPETITDFDEDAGMLVATDRDGRATYFAIPALSVVASVSRPNRPLLVDGRYTRIVDQEGRCLAALPTRVSKAVRVRGPASEWLALADGAVIHFALEGR